MLHGELTLVSGTSEAKVYWDLFEEVLSCLCDIVVSRHIFVVQNWAMVSYPFVVWIVSFAEFQDIEIATIRDIKGPLRPGETYRKIGSNTTGVLGRCISG